MPYIIHVQGQKKEVKVRPLTESGINKMRTWLISQDWSEILEAESAHTKAYMLQRMLLKKFKEMFPEKTHQVSSDDQPWITHKLKS